MYFVFIRMLRGLKALHDLKILHLDLKSANIFLFCDGSAKIGDCNVSKIYIKVSDIHKQEHLIMLLLKYGMMILMIIKVI